MSLTLLTVEENHISTALSCNKAYALSSMPSPWFQGQGLTSLVFQSKNDNYVMDL